MNASLKPFTSTTPYPVRFRPGSMPRMRIRGDGTRRIVPLAVTQYRLTQLLLQQCALQCRKCRTPVKTIAMSCSFAAAITSSSRKLPPGWITHDAPASTTTSSPSRNGKNASEATADPASVRPADSALIDAMRAESTRDICPAPMPSVMPSCANTIAFDLTNFATFTRTSGRSPAARWACAP